MELFHGPEPLYKEKGLYEDLHVFSLGTSFFRVSEPVVGVKLGIFLNPRAYMGRAWNFSKFQGLYTRRKVYDDSQLASLGASLF